MSRIHLASLFRILKSRWFSLLAGLMIMTWIFIFFEIDLRVLLFPRDTRLQLVLLLLLPNLILNYWRWGFLTRKVQPDLSWRTLSGPFLLGYASGLVTPANLGVHLRALYLDSKNPTSLVTISFLDKLLNGIVSGSFGLWGLWQVLFRGSGLNVAVSPYTLLLISCCFALLLFLLYRPSLLYLLVPHRWRHPESVPTRITLALQSVSATTLTLALVVTVSAYLVYMLQFLLLLGITTGEFNLALFAPLAGMMFIKSFVSFTWGDLGIRELLTTWLLAPYHVSQSAAVQAAVLVFEINILLPALMGAIVMLLRRRR
ncbi:MAG: flippase-like domain-containing protein [Candidatus Delongbacteria bacterium]|nr:flippase-like domain-containing protein [Candidatus Delongbacteria bacterium]